LPELLGRINRCLPRQAAGAARIRPGGDDGEFGKKSFGCLTIKGCIIISEVKLKKQGQNTGLIFQSQSYR
jgi:hypothetical protein